MEWITKNAGELYVSSSGLSKPADQFGFGYPFLSYKDIFHNYYAPKELTTLVNTTQKDREKCSIIRGDVFLTRTSETTEELGMSCVALKDYPEATFNGFAKRLRPVTDEIYPEYAAYFFRSAFFRAQCKSMASLITRASLNDAMIYRFKIKFPKNKYAQIKIGTILKTYDTLIENNTKRIRLLEQMAENLYKEWFVRFRFPGHENVEMENGLPKGWKVERIGNVCETIGGGTPSTSNENYWGGDIKWVTPSDITSKSSLPLLNIAGRITEEGLKRSSAKLLPPYTILMTSRASIGFFGICPESVCTNQGFISIIPNEENTRMFLLYSLKTRKEEIIANANGSTFLEISKGRFRKMKTLVPSEDILIKFEKKEQLFFNEILKLELQNQLLTRQRDLLLPRLMSGKLEVTV